MNPVQEFINIIFHHCFPGEVTLTFSVAKLVQAVFFKDLSPYYLNFFKNFCGCIAIKLFMPMGEIIP